VIGSRNWECAGVIEGCWAVWRSDRWHRCSILEYSGLLVFTICQKTDRKHSEHLLSTSIQHKFNMCIDIGVASIGKELLDNIAVKEWPVSRLVMAELPPTANKSSWLTAIWQGNTRWLLRKSKAQTSRVWCSGNIEQDTGNWRRVVNVLGMY
jgi:hypothetical protein